MTVKGKNGSKRNKKELGKAKVVVNWNYTNESAPGFRRLMALLLASSGKREEACEGDKG